jgi:hypothetical protein
MITAYFDVNDLFFDWKSMGLLGMIDKLRNNAADIKNPISKQSEILYRLLHNRKLSNCYPELDSSLLPTSRIVLEIEEG